MSFFYLWNVFLIIKENYSTFFVVIRLPHNERNLSFLRPDLRWLRWPDSSPLLFEGIFIEDATEANDAIRILLRIFSVCSFLIYFSEDLKLFVFFDGVSIEACRCLWNNEKNVPEEVGDACLVCILCAFVVTFWKISLLIGY